MTRPAPRTWIAIALLAVALAALGALLLRPGLTPYLAVDELAAQAERYQGRPVRLAGRLVGEVTRAADGAARFRVETRGAALDVACADRVPAGLEPGAEILLDGRLDARGVFQAHRLLTRCASRYRDKLDKEPVDPRP